MSKHDIPASKRYHGEEVENYDSRRNKNPVTLEDDEVIREFLGVAKNSIIADVPCGTGRTLASLPASGDLKYFGSDVSSDMLEACKEKAISLGMQVGEDGQVRLSCADARVLPWENSFADVLVSFKFLKWLPNDHVLLEVLKEFRRVCKGRALLNLKISPESGFMSVREAFDRIKKIRDRVKYGCVARSIKKDRWEEMLSEAGWRIEDVKVNSASNGIVYNYIVY